MALTESELTHLYAKDLALAFAKTRLEADYRKKPLTHAPDFSEYEKFLEYFEAAYNYYANIGASNY